MSDFNYASLLTSLLGANASTKTAKDVTDLNNQLKASYSNPSSLYGQYSATDKQFYNDLQAQNAASGRTTDAYKTGVAREAAYNNWLTQYRSNLSNQIGNYAKTASTYNTANPYMTVLGSLLGNQKDSNGATVQSPLAQAANQGLTSSIGWLGNQAKSLFNSGTADTGSQQSSDPIANAYGTYGNDVSNAMTNAINGNTTGSNSNNSFNSIDYGNSDNTTSNYSDTYNAASDPIAQNIGNTNNYDTDGVDYLSNLFGGS